MIEAVNSVLSSAPLVRQNTDAQSNTAPQNNPQTESVRAVTQAPYISPYISVDINFDTAVILLRDAETGDTVRQIPSEGALEARQREQAVAQTSQESLVKPNIQGDALNVQVESTQVTTPAPQASAPAQSAPISQSVLSAFELGSQTSAAPSSSFATSA